MNDTIVNSSHDHKKLLRVSHLKTYFYTHDGIVKAVDAVDFSVKQGQTLGIVGESGSGKSVTALSIMRLIPQPPGKIVSGNVLFEGKDLCNLSEKEMRKIRGRKISMIFQEPMTSLDPVFTIGHEIIETILLHQNVTKKEAREKAIQMLEMVGIPDANKRMDNYPHELSGGMRQRIMIAMALSCNPALLIADEPTTALDVTIQAQILRLINNLKKTFNTAVLMITHDLGVISEMCDDVAVMYAGHIVEYSDVYTIFEHPMHPYTKGLYRSIPRMDREVKKLDTIRGMIPNLLNLPPGCPFNSRCEYAFDRCFKEIPKMVEVEPNHWVKCHLIEEKLKR
ncbi:MAG: ABC transporter ATP-binding protein [Candidatus Atribacteria bacterium]|nr:ABC transporter ATP-binding protein [Candidatus Atribacteria bacterium]